MPSVFTSPLGLSPRVRGNPGGGGELPRPGRSIPACAGEPRPAAPAEARPGVYPRVCGGTGGLHAGGGLPEGLSPRVRGNRDGPFPGRRGRGSIPACAGEPATTTSARAAASVYPRVCGGTPPDQEIWMAGARSIPACAGEPNRLDGRHHRRRVYPRVCGGTHTDPAARPAEEGLSPRVRGNLGYWRWALAC